MGSLYYFLFALLVTTISHGLPLKDPELKKSASASHLLSQDYPSSTGRTPPGVTYKAEHAYVYRTTTTKPLHPSKQIAKNVAGIIKRIIVTEPKKMYDKNVKNGQWKETIKKGKDFINRKFGKNKSISASKVDKPATPYPKFFAPAARHQSFTKPTYLPHHDSSARREAPKTFRQDSSTFQPPNPYVFHPNSEYAPSAPPLDPGVPPFDFDGKFHRRSETLTAATSHYSSTPAPTAPSGARRGTGSSIKGFSKIFNDSGKKKDAPIVLNGRLRESLEAEKVKIEEGVTKVQQGEPAWMKIVDKRLEKKKMKMQRDRLNQAPITVRFAPASDQGERLYRRADASKSPSPYEYMSSPSKSPPPDPVKEIERNLKIMGKKAVKFTNKMYETRVKNGNWRNTIKEAKSTVKKQMEVVGQKHRDWNTKMEAKLEEKEMQRERTKQHSSSSSHQYSSWVPNHPDNLYQPSAPPEPLSPRFDHSSPRRSFRA